MTKVKRIINKARIIFFVSVVLVLIVYVGGCRRAGGWLVKEDVPVHADAMVLLMGGISDRVLQAADLYRERRAGRLIIVEESMGSYKRLEARGIRIISNTDQAKDAAIKLGIPADSITVLPGDAKSTINEAEVIAEYLTAAGNIDTIIIVSSAPHTRRASMIFRMSLRSAHTDVSVFCSPSRYTGFDADRWWRDKEDVQVVLSEFVKICSFVGFERRRLK
ncbi:MAG: YdcF family protein [Bacteroidales bacterium]|nr:YdcF family protein [Bacteroidales bacterium]